MVQVWFLVCAGIRRQTRLVRDWSADVCSSDLNTAVRQAAANVVSQPVDLSASRVGGGEVSGRLLRAPAWDALLRPVYGEGGPSGCSLRVPGRRGRLSPFFPLRKPEPGRPPGPRRSREAGGPKYFSNFASCSSVRSPRSFSLSFSVEARMRGRSSSNVNFISSRLALNADSTVAACLSVSLRSRWMQIGRAHV